MHEYLQMSSAANAFYIVYWIICLGYGAFVLAASVLTPHYRHRVHRGSWLHIAEGWAVAAVLWAGCAWASHEVTVGSAIRSRLPPIPTGVHNAAFAFWILVPPTITVSFVMAVTTIVRALEPPALPSAPERGERGKEQVDNTISSEDR
jgi:hypothetical protein